MKVCWQLPADLLFVMVQLVRLLIQISRPKEEFEMSKVGRNSYALKLKALAIAKKLGCCPLSLKPLKPSTIAVYLVGNFIIPIHCDRKDFAEITYRGSKIPLSDIPSPHMREKMVEQFPSLYPEAKKERHRQEVVSRRRGHAQQAENLQREQEAKEKSTQPCGIQVVEERNVFLEQLASTHNVSSPSGQRGSKLQDEVSQQLAGLLRGH